MSPDMKQAAKVLSFPDMKPVSKKDLMGPEIGTQFDYGQRLFAYYGGGDVFLPPTTASGPQGT